jgi:hypothetical protein
MPIRLMVSGLTLNHLCNLGDEKYRLPGKATRTLVIILFFDGFFAIFLSTRHLNCVVKD